MKKIISLLLVLATTICIFAGCSSDASDETTTQPATETTEAVETTEDSDTSSDSDSGIVSYDPTSSNVHFDFDVSVPQYHIEAYQIKIGDLYSDLQSAFTTAGVAASVSSETGEIAMDATVLFAGDSAELSAKGKAEIKKFVKSYTDVIYNNKYKGFIKKTIIEGHIAPVKGVTYEEGLPLSEKRAKAVKDYCLSKEIGLDTADFAKTIETIGYSNKKPILKADGTVDLDASRRVSFKFIVDENAE